MRTLNFAPINGVSNDGNKVSDAIDMSQVFAISAIGTFSDAASTGTLKLQGSNDIPVDTVAPPQFVPTNWADVPSATVAVTAGGTVVFEKNPICYRWVRVSWTRTAGAGTFSVRVNTQGF